MLPLIIDTFFRIVFYITCGLSLLYCVLTFFVLLFVKRRPESAESIPDEKLPYVTVQIPTYNELAGINCAARCLNFDYPHAKLQIILGDDSNRPEISAQIDAFVQKHPRITLSRRASNVGYKPGNLNQMNTLSTGEYILIFDSDFLPEKDFLRKIVAPVVHDPSLAGVQATWLVENVYQNFTTLMAASIVNIIHRIILPILDRTAHGGIFCGSAELVRKDLLLRYGGWTPGTLTEDVDYSLRIIADGHRILYLDNVFCSGEVPYMVRDLSRQQMRWAYGVIRAFLDNGKRLFASRVAKLGMKLAVICFASGYLLFSSLLLCFFAGLLQILVTATIAPPPVYPDHRWYQVGGYAVVDFLITGGFLIAGVVGGFIAGFSPRCSFKLVLSSLTIGFVLMFYIGKGIFLALCGLPMQWFMVRKNGNSTGISSHIPWHCPPCKG